MTGRVTVASVGPTPFPPWLPPFPSPERHLSPWYSPARLPGHASYTYAWSFGDGTADSSEQNPPHTYAQLGTYSAVLTVTDAVPGTAQAAPVGITVTNSSPNPPVVTSMKKGSPGFAIVVVGSDFQSAIKVFIAGAQWNGVVWKNAGKIKVSGGKALKAAVPKGSGHGIPV